MDKGKGQLAGLEKFAGIKKALTVLLFLPVTFFYVQGVFAGPATFVAQYGIKWTFDGTYEVGQFANGDYWVVGPVRILSITPDFDGRHNGWEVNPVNAGGQGFEEGAGVYDATLVPTLPYTAQPGESIIKGFSVNQDPASAPDCYPKCLQTAAVLTVVSSIPPGNGAAIFRPPYVGTDKPYYSTADIDTSKLPSLALTTDVTLSSVEDNHRRVQLDHKSGRMGRMIKPYLNLPSYGAAIAALTNTGIMRLMLDDPIADKMTALIYVLQAGIDRYHMVVEGQRWPGGGGHNPGKKLSISFAAVLLDNTNMKTLIADSTALEYFSEDWVLQLGKDGKAIFGLTKYQTELGYWESMSQVTSHTAVERYDWYRYIDGGNSYWMEVNYYQSCCLSQPWKGSMLALTLMPEMKTFWNSALLSDYVHRWTTKGAKFAPDPCAGVPAIDRGKKRGEWVEYGITWGSDGKGDCIKDGVGRFPERNGIRVDGGNYRSKLVDELWAKYVGSPLLPITPRSFKKAIK